MVYVPSDTFKMFNAPLFFLSVEFNIHRNQAIMCSVHFEWLMFPEIHFKCLTSHFLTLYNLKFIEPKQLCVSVHFVWFSFLEIHFKHLTSPFFHSVKLKIHRNQANMCFCAFCMDYIPWDIFQTFNSPFFCNSKFKPHRTKQMNKNSYDTVLKSALKSHTKIPVV